MDFEKVKNNVYDLISGKELKSSQVEKILSEDEKEERRQEYLNILSKIENYSQKVSEVPLECGDPNYNNSMARNNCLTEISLGLQLLIRKKIIIDKEAIDEITDINNYILSLRPRMVSEKEPRTMRTDDEVKEIAGRLSKAINILKNNLDLDGEINQKSDKQTLAN